MTLKGQRGDAAECGPTLQSGADHPHSRMQYQQQGPAPPICRGTLPLPKEQPPGLRPFPGSLQPGAVSSGCPGTAFPPLGLADSEGPFQLQRPLGHRQGLLYAPAPDPSLTLRSAPREPARTTPPHSLSSGGPDFRQESPFQGQNACEGPLSHVFRWEFQRG